MTSNKASYLRGGAAAAAIVLALGLCGGAALAAPPAKGPIVGVGAAEKVQAKVTIKSVDKATRHITVTNSAGENFKLKVAPEVQNFDTMKAGDKITLTYLRETEFVISAPNSKLPPDTDTLVAARAKKGDLPAGAVANRIVVTGAVLGIDRVAQTLKIVSPQGGEVHTVAVKSAQGKAVLPQVKVGDTITAYVTEALVLSTSPA